MKTHILIFSTLVTLVSTLPVTLFIDNNSPYWVIPVKSETFQGQWEVPPRHTEAYTASNATGRIEVKSNEFNASITMDIYLGMDDKAPLFYYLQAQYKFDIIKTYFYNTGDLTQNSITPIGDDMKFPPVALEWYGYHPDNDEECQLNSTKWSTERLWIGFKTCYLVKVRQPKNLKPEFMSNMQCQNKTIDINLQFIGQCFYTDQAKYNRSHFIFGPTPAARANNLPFNCMSWAIQNFTGWSPVPKDEDKARFQFYSLSYEEVPCDKAATIALYCEKDLWGACKIPRGPDPIIYEHVARKLPNDLWSSKFGEGILLSHGLREITGTSCKRRYGIAYGEPALCFKRVPQSGLKVSEPVLEDFEDLYRQAASDPKQLSALLKLLKSNAKLQEFISIKLEDRREESFAIQIVENAFPHKRIIGIGTESRALKYSHLLRQLISDSA